MLCVDKQKSGANGRRADIVIVVTIIAVLLVWESVSAMGCNGRNLVAATASGLVDSPVVELFAVAESMVLLLGMFLFLKDVFLCLSLRLRVSLRGIFLASAPQGGGHFNRDVRGPNHNTHEAQNKTVKEARAFAGMLE